MAGVEHQRLAEHSSGSVNWLLWGPYLSERQWGTVREDYSASGDAWNDFPHEHARSRAYRWGEDGLGGWSDERQRLCLGVALWNGCDAILKERLFGVTNAQGNHGEDVKESYFFLDGTPTHSYQRMLYKYPQKAFPYEELIRANQSRSRLEEEFDLTQSGIFRENRYFDVFIEYAKAGPGVTCQRITVTNHGPEAAPLTLLVQLWCRNVWSWGEPERKPALRFAEGGVRASNPELGAYRFEAEGAQEWLFTDNETNFNRLFRAGECTWPKDAFHDCIILGDTACVNPEQEGTKAAAVWRCTLGPGETREFHTTLRPLEAPVPDFADVLAKRRAEADEFYRQKTDDLSEERAGIYRQAAAGLTWSKQFYRYNVRRWIEGDPTGPQPPPSRANGRNARWQHVNAGEIILMPDTWEYPWFAAWDLAFHAVAYASVDPAFAKEQLLHITNEWYLHPNGQLPAYEWAFDDANPPVHGWAAWRVFLIDRERRGDRGDIEFLERVFHKLILNFGWWINRKDADGQNIFEGGFLGMDNLGVFDRSQPLPPGLKLHQCDATAWMAMCSLNLMRIAAELALTNPAYEDIAAKFLDHFLRIASAMNNVSGQGLGLWDEEDQFFYDVVTKADGRPFPLKVRSIAGLLPLLAVETLEAEHIERLPRFAQRLDWILKHEPGLASLVSRWQRTGRKERRLFSLLRVHRMKSLLHRMFDPEEFLSPYGIRALSRHHLEHPYVLPYDGRNLTVGYDPGESKIGAFGGNSNWRGPIWMPVNYLLVEALLQFHQYYGDSITVECPCAGGNANLRDWAVELATRLVYLFERNEDGCRPIFANDDLLQCDPQFRDYLLYPEYFHGDTGRGLGAMHQTGWTALIMPLLKLASGSPEDIPLR